VNVDCVRLRRLKDAVKSVEQLEESIKSLRQWLSDMYERFISPVVYQRADTDEIQRHLGEQEVSGDVNTNISDVIWLGVGNSPQF